MKNALFIVNPQIDFVSEGNSTQVLFGDRIIPIINSIINKFDFVIASQETFEAKFYPNFNFNGEIFTKYISDEKESAFFSKNSDGMNVYEYLKQNNISQVYLAGLSGDCNVKDTAIDCSKYFETYFILDAVKFTSSPDDTIEILIKNKIKITNTTDLTFSLLKEPFYKEKVNEKVNEKSNDPLEDIFQTLDTSAWSIPWVRSRINT